MNVASTETVDVFKALASAAFFTGFSAAAVEEEVAEDVEDVAAAGAGVAERLGSALTVRSFPWVSTRSTGNLAKIASRRGGMLAFAIARRSLTAGLEPVDRVQKN